MKRYEFVLTPPHQRGSGGKEDEEKRKLYSKVKARNKGKKPPQRVSSAPARAPWVPPKKNIGEDIWKKIDEFRGKTTGEEKKKYEKMLDVWSKASLYADNSNKIDYRNAAYTFYDPLRGHVVGQFYNIGSKSGQFVWDKLNAQMIKKMGEMRKERFKQFPPTPIPRDYRGDRNVLARKNADEATDKYLKINPGKFGKNRPNLYDAAEAFDDWFNTFMEDIMVKQIKDPSWRPLSVEQRARSSNRNINQLGTMEQGELRTRREAKAKIIRKKKK